MDDSCITLVDEFYDKINKTQNAELEEHHLVREQVEKDMVNNGIEAVEACQILFKELTEALGENLPQNEVELTLISIRDRLKQITSECQKERDEAYEQKEEQKREHALLDSRLVKLKEEFDAIEKENQQLDKQINETDSYTILRLMKSSG